MNKITFNKPFLTGKEVHYMYQAVYSMKLSGNGMFTKKCQEFFVERYGIKKCLLTTSGTDALEMCAMLCDLKDGDEVIVPSYTFVSTAIAFIREGASIIFADSMDNNPNLDVKKIESLITPRTKVIVPVHYAGVSCDMDAIMALAKKYNLIVVEDAAQAIESFYKDRPLGSIGHLGSISFHETKNITAGGEGGLLTINDDRFIKRAEIIWEKGTNRAEYFRGSVNKYGWVDIGSSFLPNEISAAFLWAQLENLDKIQEKRRNHWEQYYLGLQDLAIEGKIRLPQIPDYATNNGHMFYIICSNIQERSELITYLENNGICAPFHYLSLHKSEYYINTSELRPELPNSDIYSDCLVRLPMFYELTTDQINYVVQKIINYYGK